MKIEVKSYYSISSLLSAILFFIIGAILFNNPDAMVIIISRLLGGIIGIVGFIKCIKNYIEVKKDNETSSIEMIIGLICILIGLIFIFLANVIETLIRFIIGGWILFCGINRLINSIYISKKSSKFYVMLVISLLLIGGGVYTILEANLPIKIIGVILMCYSFIEIVGYIVNKLLGDTSLKEDNKKKSKKSDIKEAVVIEDKTKSEK